MTTTPFTAAGVTVTTARPAAVTLADTAGRSITVSLDRAEDIAFLICGAMRSGCSVGRSHSRSGDYVTYDGRIGLDEAPFDSPIWAVSALYTHIFAAAEDVRTEPMKAVLARHGVHGEIRSGTASIPHLCISEADAARLLAVDPAALRRLAALGLLGNTAVCDGWVRADAVLRAMGGVPTP